MDRLNRFDFGNMLLAPKPLDFFTFLFHLMIRNRFSQLYQFLHDFSHRSLKTSSKPQIALFLRSTPKLVSRCIGPGRNFYPLYKKVVWRVPDFIWIFFGSKKFFFFTFKFFFFTIRCGIESRVTLDFLFIFPTINMVFILKPLKQSI